LKEERGSKHVGSWRFEVGSWSLKEERISKVEAFGV
jgi:hypothetical protein